MTLPVTPPMPTALAPLPTTALGPLTLAPAQHPQGRTHLSAASGLVRLGQRLYVVADDELHLGVFALEPTGTAADRAAPGTLLRLLEGDLPSPPAARKAAKPDLETLALLPALPSCPAGALLALGSGSQAQRNTGVLVALDAQGVPNGRMARVDLAALYAPLRARFADLNIEGALVSSGELLLLHRGNKGGALSACIHFDWNQIAPWLVGRQAQPPAPKRVQPLALGEVDGVPLALTDATPLHGGAWAFCAVAEDTLHSYHDGRCVASAIGTVAPGGELQHLQLLQGAPKVEGIAAQAQGADWLFTLVTDPDDPATPAQLLQARLTPQR